MESFCVIKPKFIPNSLTTKSMDISEINQKTTVVSANAILRKILLALGKANQIQSRQP